MKILQFNLLLKKQTTWKFGAISNSLKQLADVFGDFFCNYCNRGCDKRISCGIMRRIVMTKALKRKDKHMKIKVISKR